MSEVTQKETLQAMLENAHSFPGAADMADALERAIQATPDTPPIAADADPEYRARIDAAQVSWQFTDALRPRKPQASVEDLPLFGGERQEEMF